MIVLGPGVVIHENELEWKATRSGGPGGQNVNKVATRIELTWDLAGSEALQEWQRLRLLRVLETRIDTQGKLRIVASEGRSQSQNRDEALTRLKALVTEALKPRKKRRPTKPTKGSQRRRLDAKKQRGAIKKQRRDRPGLD